MNLYLEKNEKIVIDKRAIAVIKAPIRNGFNSVKVKTVVE